MVKVILKVMYIHGMKEGFLSGMVKDIFLAALVFDVLYQLERHLCKYTY